VIACEPVGAACLLQSLRANKRATLTGTLPTVMAGLRCGEISNLAWPVLAATVDAAVAIEDKCVISAMWSLSHPLSGDPMVVSGESEACGMATLFSILRDPLLQPVQRACRLGPSSRVLAFNTEGATDPEFYANTTGLSPD
jgi:diaminopropionate ammonia-lyase